MLAERTLRGMCVRLRRLVAMLEVCAVRARRQHMNPSHSRFLRGVCRVVGHRWTWRLAADDWPYQECTRCGSSWELGRPIPRDFEDFKASVLANCRTPGLTADEVWRDASVRYPDMRAGLLLRLAEQTVGELLDEGSIRLVCGPRAGPENQRRAVDDAEHTLGQWSTWATQVDDVIWLEAVDAG